MSGQIIEVHGLCPPEEAARRYAERFKAGERHAAHMLSTMTPEMPAEFDRPPGVGRGISIDTRNPVNIEDLVAQLRSMWQISEDMMSEQVQPERIGND